MTPEERAAKLFSEHGDEFSDQCTKSEFANMERLVADAVRAALAEPVSAIRQIDQIVHTPTKRSRYSSALDHFQGDFDQIRKLTAPFRVEGGGNVG